jgi:hypothetical protein
MDLDPRFADHLARVLDVEGKIPKALDALGPVGGRDVALVDAAAGLRARQLADLGARVTVVGRVGDSAFAAPEASADVVVAYWSAFRGAATDEIEAAGRLLRPGGRLLVVHDYGRDDVSRFRGERPEYADWSRRDGPFLRGGFKIRVLHCWWTFESLDDARSFLADAFGEAGRVTGEALARPRLSYNVAVYHRTFGAANA